MVLSNYLIILFIFSVPKSDKLFVLDQRSCLCGCVHTVQCNGVGVRWSFLPQPLWFCDFWIFLYCFRQFFTFCLRNLVQINFLHQIMAVAEMSPSGGILFTVRNITEMSRWKCCLLDQETGNAQSWNLVCCLCRQGLSSSEDFAVLIFPYFQWIKKKIYFYDF